MSSRWVFAYGSLMWNPGFAHVRAVPARLEGYHRRLCVYSFHYRGRPDQPGLVFGLEKGGHCDGLAYEVSATDWPQTQAYLRQREQISMVYDEVELPVLPRTLPGRVTALTYVVNGTHPQCASGLAEDEIIRLVRQGQGKAGPCIDYVRNTWQALRQLDIPEPGLERILERLQAAQESHSR